MRAASRSAACRPRSRRSSRGRTCRSGCRAGPRASAARVSSLITRGPETRSPYLAVSEMKCVHLGDAALVEQVDDQLELVQALEIGDLGLVAGLDQGLEAGDDQLGGAAAQHGLLAEQVGLGLLARRWSRSRRRWCRRSPGHRPAPCRAPGRSRPGATANRQGTPRPISYSRRTRSPGPLGATSTTSRSRARVDLAVMDREAVRDEQGRARREVRRDRLGIDLRWVMSGRQQGDQAAPRAPHRPASAARKPSAWRALLGAAAGPRADDDVEAAVAQVARMGAALAAITDDRDRPALERCRDSRPASV